MSPAGTDGSLIYLYLPKGQEKAVKCDDFFIWLQIMLAWACIN